MKKTKPLHTTGFYHVLVLITAVCVLLAGGYYEICAVITGIALLVAFIWYICQGRISFYINDTAFAFIVIAVSYILSCFWAVDSSVAFWGIAKIFPVLMFSLCVMQIDSGDKNRLILNLPYMAAFIVIISLILQFVPILKSQIVISGRLGGVFGYPNTFAMFLLVCLWITQWISGRYTMVVQWILVMGIVLSGSRTVFVMTAVVFIYIVISKLCKRKMLWKLLMVIFLAVVSALLFNHITGMNVVSHVAGTTSGNGVSTFWGRLLYYQDALPVILNHPFGMGYLGYYFTQGSFQHGVYTVRWVHNDILQLLLDVGWIPAILLIVAVVKAFISKNCTLMQKGMLAIIVVHGVFDFDLEFVAVWFVLILSLDLTAGKRKQYSFEKLEKAVTGIVGVCISLVPLYAGIVSSAIYFGENDIAAKLSPRNTFVLSQELSNADNAAGMTKYADAILSHNRYIAIAWDAKARVAYSSGDFEKVIKYKENAIECNRYNIEEYTDYFELLANGYTVYLKAQDIDSAQICYEKAKEIQTKLDRLKANTGNLARKLKDIPQLEMPETYKQFILQGGSK